jgi:hypothetical protein
MRYREVETLTRVTPLGIRFWDAAAARPVREGLRVRAWPEGAAGPGTTAFRTVSGVYAFHGLPGLEALEWGETPFDPLAEPLRQERYVVSVEDLGGRFVPVAFVVDLPRRERGVYPPAESGSLPEAVVPGFVLFSAPARAVPAGAAAVRAHLEDALTREPAAHAVLEVEVEGEVWLGLADASGAVAVCFPTPPFRHALSGSFPAGGTPLHEHAWTATARLRYAPASVVVAPEVRLPLLGSVSDQAAGLLYAEPPGSLADPPLDALDLTLVYGRETVLRTAGLSTLLVEPAPSLP